jgi:hypothetical protein
MNRKSLALTCFAVLACATHAQAALINAVNVDLGKNSEIYSGVAAAPDLGMAWNGITWGGTTVSDLFDSMENPTTIDMTITGGKNNWASGSGTPQNPHDLMVDYRFGQNSTMSVNLAQVPAGAYKLYVYSAGDGAGQGAAISVDLDNQIAGGVASSATTGADRDIYNVANPGVNYVILDAQPDSNGNIDFTLANPSNYFALNGFQLVPAVPEPAALSGLGMAAALLARRIRK